MKFKSWGLETQATGELFYLNTTDRVQPLTAHMVLQENKIKQNKN